MGGYIKRMRGIRMVFKAENAPGHRIDRLYLEGEPAEDERIYKVGFITAQGVPRKFGHNRTKLTVKAIDALRARLRRPFTAESVNRSVEIV